MKEVQLYTDGAAISNPSGESGAGVVLVYNNHAKEWSIPLGIGSNMRAELGAIIEGLKLLKEPCMVYLYSDAQVIVNCILGVYGRNSNLDLWEEYDRLAKGHEIHATWIRKDSHKFNMRCHHLANQAAYKGQK